MPRRNRNRKPENPVVSNVKASLAEETDAAVATPAATGVDPHAAATRPHRARDSHKKAAAATNNSVIVTVKAVTVTGPRASVSNPAGKDNHKRKVVVSKVVHPETGRNNRRVNQITLANRVQAGKITVHKRTLAIKLLPGIR